MDTWLQERDRLIMAQYIELIRESITDESVLLEVGCGRGNSSLEDVYRKCKRVIGVDSDFSALEDNVYIDEKIHSPISEVNLEEGSVDIIISAWVFEHIERPIESVENMKRILKKDGILIFITPNKNSLPTFFSRLTPQFFHNFMCKILYKRLSQDTYPAFYKLNSVKDLEIHLQDFTKQEIVMFDDVKFFGSLVLFRPLASLWNYIIMSRFLKKFRAIIIAKYIKV